MTRPQDALPADVDALLQRAGDLVGRPLHRPVPLGGGRRSQVLRVEAVGTDGAEPLVLKRFTGLGGPATAPWREAAGLRLLPGTPDLLADDGDLLVMSDAGAGPTLADVLRGDLPDAALAAAVGWAGALGALTAGGATRLQAFAALVPAGAEPRSAWPRTDPPAAATRLLTLVGDDELAAALADDLAEVARLAEPSPLDVLTQGDTCPDNALLRDGPDDVVFVDLEATGVHHAALGAAYLVLPFASCWCVFEPPAGLVDELAGAWTEQVAPVLPDVVDDDFWDRDVPVAAAAWVLSASTWLLDGALEGRPRVGPPDGAAPSYRELLVGRWRWLARELPEVLPAVAELGGRLVEWSERAWGPQPRRGYPAFSS